jgi:hypothetical protein
MVASSEASDKTCVIHHRRNKLLVQQHTVSDGEAASPVKEGAKHAQSFSCLLSHLVYVRRPGKLSINGHHKIPCCFDALYWLSENCTALGFWMRLAALTKSTALLFET